ncbi:MAG: hypothetical protein WBF55_12890, partial [Syntrophobacteria bacterium]
AKTPVARQSPRIKAKEMIVALFMFFSIYVFLFPITTSKDHHTAMNYPLSPPFVVNLVSSLQ